MTPTDNLEAGAGDLVRFSFLRLPGSATLTPCVRPNGEWVQYSEAAAQLAAVTAENARLREALNLIDALDPEEHIYGTSHDACRGLIIRMGQMARAALSQEAPK